MKSPSAFGRQNNMNSLIKKYNAPVPRYTSYPPANYFKDPFPAKNYLDAVKKSNNWEPESVSLYFHIPFCRKMCFYCGCNSCPLPDKKTVDNYFEALKSELLLVTGLIDKNRKVSQVHFGGGTPNSVPSGYMTQLMDLLHENFAFSPSPEIAIECNPAYLDINYIKQLIRAGFNRFSLGIQDFSEQVLKGVNREPSSIPVKDIVSFLRAESPYAKVNMDFIYGLPGQTTGSFLNTIEKAAGINPDRLVTFSYAHVPWVNKAQEKLEKRGLPGNEEKAAMYRKASDLLIENGYKAIGLDHFVLEKDELYQALQSGRLHRNFQGYCTRNTTGQVYAFGVSAISQLRGVYAQNTKLVDEYIVSLSKGLIPTRKGYVLSRPEIIIREVITELMCNKMLIWASLAKQLKSTLPEIMETINYDRKLLNQFKEDGIIDFTDDYVKITGKGSLFIRNVAASFDPLMAEGNKKFSRSF